MGSERKEIGEIQEKEENHTLNPKLELGLYFIFALFIYLINIFFHSSSAFISIYHQSLLYKLNHNIFAGAFGYVVSLVQ